jgi:Fur family ferric uptake transcriptional regulator
MAHGKVQRNTRQREVILEELRKLRSHPTAVGLYEIVRRRLPRISLGTVYRNLELLAGMGEIQRLHRGGSQARFDGNIYRHDHVRCVGCGRVDDFSGAPLDLAQVRSNDFSGYELLDYRLEFVGICPCCREQSNMSHRKRKGNEPC